MNLKSKLPGVGTTIFTVMSQLAADHGAINLGQGFPDFDPDPRLVDEVRRAMKEGYNQYPPMPGIPQLRTGIQEKVKALYGHEYDANSEVTVMAGASEALMSSILALVHAGDEVVIIEPFYDLYIPVIQLAGAVPVIVPMLAPDAHHNRHRVDWQRVRDAIGPRTKALILNFPHNPTGINLVESDLDALERIVEETGILLISDEVYEHIVFDGGLHLSMSRREKLAAHSVVISSFGKTYHVTGWKIGYCCAPAKITAEIRKVHQFNVFTVVAPMQYAISRYMQDAQHHLSLANFYQEKRDRLYEGLAQTRFRPVKSEGTFFLLADYSEISNMPESEFAQWLTKEHGVGVIPVSAFYRDPASADANHGLVRFCFAKKEATLDAAIERLKVL
jgi:methionine aminotransferase